MSSESTKLLAVAAGALGVAGAVAVSQSANVVHAASGTVTYREGATTVWQTPAFSQPKRYLSFNQTVTITGSKVVNGATWYQLGPNEWVPAAYLKQGGQAATQKPATPAPAPSTPKAPVTPVAPSQPAQTAVTISYREGATTVWQTPGYTASTGCYLTFGTKLAVVSKVTVAGETWYKLSDGGYVPGRFVTAAAAAAPQTPAAKVPAQPAQKPESTPATPPQVSQSSGRAAQVQAVIALAKQQLGKPYVWGGKGPSSFDCSGLMHYVFLNALGKEIGGWTVPQESSGQHLSIDQLQPGDLVFWGSVGNTYHVALYLGGNQYLHAPQPGQVVQYGTISPYFQPSFGVRVL